MYTTFHGEKLAGKHVDEVLRTYFPDYNYKGVFFDIGAFDPVQISNSHHFYMNNWDVYCFEANTELIPKLKNNRKNVFNYAIYDKDLPEVEFNVVSNGTWTAGFSAIEISEDYKKIFQGGIKSITKIKVPQKTLNTIIREEIPKVTHIDILSIDVEGGELKCLYGLDLEKYSPTVILVENVTNDINVKNYLAGFGYVLDKHISYNQFYTKSSRV